MLACKSIPFFVAVIAFLDPETESAEAPGASICYDFEFYEASG
jgi:hypothetical protein